ncbi:MAG: hypothetical protein A3E01_15390 [Gammaproteobacteria bacterium RIFCSPHIGHO2_12_FULL_63_22]|nr:MAG: hypothetical protein A3E01_15390 [Gammaproteobacteria bacterium RIFCSPHIGHO2_12_FULL_63_22]
MPSLGQQENVYCRVTDYVAGTVTEYPSYVCSHCQRTIINNPEASWRRPRPVCRSCDHYICLRCETASAHRGGECMSIRPDIDRGFEDLWKQPWMLRDAQSEPLYRILDEETGDTKLVRRTDVGYTGRQMANLAGYLNHDGTSRLLVGERPPA